MIKKTLILVIGILIVFASFAFAQEEKLTISTYYPSPYGVYNEMRFYPHSPATLTCTLEQEGLTYFDSNEHILKVCACPGGDSTKCSWSAVPGRGGGGVKVVEGHGIVPTKCPGHAGTPLFCGVFYEDITFSEPFSSPPKVLVSIEDTGPVGGCAQHTTDRVIAYPTNVTTTGFRLMAASSPDSPFCGATGATSCTRAKVGYIAIGEQ